MALEFAPGTEAPRSNTTTAGGEDEAGASYVYLARQPILDSTHQVYGYELLYRSGDANLAVIDDGTAASAAVIDTGFFVHGIDVLTRGRKAFVNFTRDALLQGFADVLPPSVTVIELLEDIQIDDQVIARCRALKSQGFMIALDDVVSAHRGLELQGIADIIKVDLLQTQASDWEQIAQATSRGRTKLLAEKVESDEIFQQTAQLGYELFQGYFFSRPQVLEARTVPVSRVAQIRILQEVNRPEIDLGEITSIISGDPSLSYRLLTLVNSVAFGVRYRVTSLRQAAMLLGSAGLQKWTSVVVLQSVTDHKPTELMVNSLVRAHLTEQLASFTQLANRGAELFIMGLFSLLDAMLDRPLEEAIKNLPLAQDVTEALLGAPGKLRDLLDLVTAYERGEWGCVTEKCARLGIDPPIVARSYEQAIRVVDEILG